MKTKAGLWIDHQVAVIVELLESGGRVFQIQSHVERQLRRSGQPAKGPFPAEEVPADDSREREYQGQLARYYDEIISQLKAVDEILILGPGEAKNELRKRLIKDKGCCQVISLQPADKMTEPQIVAHTRKYFQREAPRKGISFQCYHTLTPGQLC